ncbi:MAG: DUF2149 domain-containing protein [Desulfotomaculales bacterium]
MLRKRRLLRPGAEEVDPLAGAANLVDAILVFACGLLVALVLSWNLHSIIFSNLTGQEKRAILETIREVVQIRQGQELKDLPELVQGKGEGYQEMGTVYLDPKTGKLIMVTSGRGGTGTRPQE